MSEKTFEVEQLDLTRPHSESLGNKQTLTVKLADIEAENSRNALFDKLSEMRPEERPADEVEALLEGAEVVDDSPVCKAAILTTKKVGKN